jgi:Zn-dependent M28 family amino/carboxypeptidase
MIFYSTPGSGAPVVYFNHKRSLKERTPPSVVLSYEEALALLESRPKRVGLAVEAEVSSGRSSNVIADIRGRSRPQDIILVFTHNDTAIGAAGALDTTGAVGVLMELARAFSQMPPPERTIRFALWGGHEPGLFGSEAYLRANPDVQRLFAVISLHSQGATLGVDSWRAQGPESFIAFLRKVIDNSKLETPGGESPVGYEANSFTALEVPGVSIGQSLGPNGGHTPRDNLTGCSPAGLRGGLILGGMVIDRLANDTSLSFEHRLDPESLKRSRDRAARWGWGVRPEANLPPR